MDLTLERDIYHHLQQVSHKYARLVYNAQWYSPLRKSLDASINEAQASLSGDVRVKLYKGNATVNGRRSPNSLYDKKLATYEEDDEFDQSLSEGFVRIWGLPLEVAGRNQDWQ
jgi:argininosuccinate synthase